jgi:hypothetical protein
MYPASYAFSAPSGSTLKWSLVAAGVLQTLKNQTTGFYEGGTSGLWEWVASTIPAGFRGVVYIHSGTDLAGPGTVGLTASNTYAILSVNPGEIEKPEASVDVNGKVTTSNPARIVNPVQS